MLEILNGSKYEGSWKEDKRHGKGKSINAENGAVYEGDFHYNIKQGYGVKTMKDGRVYRG